MAGESVIVIIPGDMVMMIGRMYEGEVHIAIAVRKRDDNHLILCFPSYMWISDWYLIKVNTGDR